jgi:hypothetical protein
LARPCSRARHEVQYETEAEIVVESLSILDWNERAEKRGAA